MTTEKTGTLTYEEKFALLNRDMRWEIADLLRDANLEATNQIQSTVTPRTSFYTQYGKRVFDVVASSVGLLLSLPFNLFIAVGTLATLGRPLFFHQKRIGQHGELFTLTKFRSMREAYDDTGHPLPGHLRVTPFGRFVRRTSLDELLNFWSILKGDMSLIGPRPLVPEYLDRFSARHKQRLAVKPGLECPAPSRHQSIGSYHDQFENDVWYVENVSFLTDIKLAWRLVVLTVDRKHSKTRSRAKKGSFMGYAQDGHVVSSNAVPDWALDTVLVRHGLVTK